ncbi:MAG: hypothetical protein U0T85_08690 [Cloacibacterium normanense]
MINQGMIWGWSAFVYRLDWSVKSSEDFDHKKLPFVFVLKILEMMKVLKIN